MLVGAWRWVRFATPLVVALMLLAGCSTDDDESDPAAPTLAPTTAAQTTPPPGATVAPTDLTDANGQLVSDGICQALVPDGWVDDGTGRGTTSSGGRYTLFGGRVRSDADWENAASIVGTPSAGRQIASVDRSEDSVRATFADDRGFEVRTRFDAIYCDLTVSSSNRPIAESERAFWDAIVESIAPAA